MKYNFRQLPSIFFSSSILFVTSQNQLCFPHIFSINFSQLQLLKKKTNFLLVQNRVFLGFGPMKSLLSSSTAENSWKKLGKQYWLFGGLMSRTKYFLCEISSYKIIERKFSVCLTSFHVVIKLDLFISHDLLRK